ncbi:MAG: thiamine-phosphate kinase [Candidatus Eisenbacteria bacterium]
MVEPSGSAKEVWRTGPPVSELGEFGLIDRIRRRLEQAATDRTPGPLDAALTDIGDDAAIYRPPAGWDLLLTCDALIEGCHFQPAWITPREAGARAAEINLSDIAAMGGLPEGALVSLGLPPGLSIAAVDEIYEGLLHSLEGHGARILGGNIATSDQLFLDITLLGRVEAGKALRRSGARPGDVVFVTGSPGAAGAALAALRAEPAAVTAGGLRERMRRHHAAPRARIDVGRYLVTEDLASAAIDLSDGLAGDMRHVCEESGVAVVFEERFLPLDEDLLLLAEKLKSDPLLWVLGASDDYELLFTAPPANADRVFAAAGLCGVRVTPIGSVVAGSADVRLRKREGSLVDLPGGWDHLRSAPG